MIERAPATVDLDEPLSGRCSPLRSLRRQATSAAFTFPDTGLFGLTALRTHINICGYPRAGSTLLPMMMEYALPDARRFGKEVPGWRAAGFKWRNHSVLISKHPLDVFRIHRLRNFYKPRKARLRVILLIRDPRDVFTSRHFSTGTDRYFQDLDQWLDVQRYIDSYSKDPDVLLLKYEDLVRNPAAVQQRIDEFSGEQSTRSFTEACAEQRHDFDIRPLNGVRPVDRRGISRWRRPEHRQRIAQVLDRIPQLPRILIELGYEQDEHWVCGWRGRVAESSNASFVGSDESRFDMHLLHK
jgi:hypothetical protein